MIVIHVTKSNESHAAVACGTVLTPRIFHSKMFIARPILGRHLSLVEDGEIPR